MALKTTLLSVAAMLLFTNGQAQDTIPLYSDALAKQKTVQWPGIGLDVYQTVWVIASALRRDIPATYAYPVSVTLYMPIRNRTDSPERSVYVNAGYVAYGGLSQRNIYQTGGSMHIRSGIELTHNNLILGYGGLLTGWSGKGSFFFSGPTFGNYQEAIGQLSGMAVAGEGHVGLDIPYGQRLSLRTTLRGSMLYRLSTSQYGLYAPHLSGIDWQSKDRLGMGISFQANLVFGL